MNPSTCQCEWPAPRTYRRRARRGTTRSEPSLRVIRWRSVISCAAPARRPDTSSCPLPRFAAADSKPRKNLGATTVPPVLPAQLTGDRLGEVGEQIVDAASVRDGDQSDCRARGDQDDGAHEQCEPTWAFDSHGDMVP